jgi:hypothetical protein
MSAAREHVTDAELVAWQTGCLYRHAAFLPFLWLVFSLSYARGNARDFLVKVAACPLAGALVLPVGVAVASIASQLVASALGRAARRHQGWSCSGPPGMVMELLVLIGSVLDPHESGAHVPGVRGDDALADQVHADGGRTAVRRPDLHRLPGDPVPCSYSTCPWRS